MANDYPKLAGIVGGQILIQDEAPLIYHPEQTRFAGFEKDAQDALDRYQKTLLEDRRILFDQYRLVDAAIKVVGIGSVGRAC